MGAGLLKVPKGWYLTSPGISGWLEAFLACRGVKRPDGRALYAYRCTGEEFGSLAEALSRNPMQGGSTSHIPIRAFVLYAAEWWQREYDGRHWAWEPLLESIGWGGVHYPDLYEPVRRAWGWWKVGLVRLPTSIRYLGTFACQGGFPLALVGHGHNSVTRYLRAVLKHTAAYRRFVEDPIELARDQQHLLRPPRGDGRREWTKELENGELLDQLNMWQDPDEYRNRQPIFDTPIAAAWCCFFSKPTDRTVFLVKHIRAHDPGWFDLVYSTAWFRLARRLDDIKERK